MAFTGTTGTAKRDGDKICDLTKWSLEETAAVPKYVSNCTDGHKKPVVGGARDSKGTIEVKVDENGLLLMEPGVEYTLQLHVDDSDANYFEGQGVISSRAIEVELDSDDNIVGATYAFEGYNFVGNGILATGDALCCGQQA